MENSFNWIKPVHRNPGVLHIVAGQSALSGEHCSTVRRDTCTHCNFSKNFFSSFIMCIYMWVYACQCRVSWRPEAWLCWSWRNQRWLWAIWSGRRVLRTGRESSGLAFHVLNCGSISAPQHWHCWRGEPAHGKQRTDVVVGIGKSYLEPSKHSTAVVLGSLVCRHNYIYT